MKLFPDKRIINQDNATKGGFLQEPAKNGYFSHTFVRTVKRAV